MPDSEGHKKSMEANLLILVGKQAQNLFKIGIKGEITSGGPKEIRGKRERVRED
jgi:hypothetical protein